MKTYIKYWLMAVTTVMVCTNHVRAQEFYRENETAMHIFHELDRMFPKRYLEQRLFNQYVSRRKTDKQEVHFHGAYGRVVHNKGYSNDPTAFSEGCRYIIPKCTRADYRLFYDLFHKYLKKDVVYVASNDVYWEYEETGIRVRQANGRPLYMGAAWKNDKLYLIRLEGSHNGNGVFPRAWTEDNPIWDSSYITKKLQKNKQANQK